ncbi:hypothetical protein [Clostridium sp. ZS2-4]|uniref:hypothetical protein n=1 Tax=Clostridium sp. ZS2-4 TaxID=2987703 RepID=UPI00227B8D9B|nr:hypothetical protein [Clostridium sp. ZS2-4]MCY6355965.1 hypothetical protein [Clostridium sp. ZS2-4]
MAKAIRKNIYIPEEQTELYQNGEELAKEQDLSMSMLILQGIKMFIDANKNKGNTITLTIKQYENNSKIPTMKQIKFIGEKIAESDYICDKKFLDYVKTHNYTIYRTKKDKLLVHINMVLTDSVKNEMEKQTFSHKIYNTLEEMVQDLKDLPPETIEDIVKHDIVEEFLDI